MMKNKPLFRPGTRVEEVRRSITWLQPNDSVKISNLSADNSLRCRRTAIALVHYVAKIIAMPITVKTSGRDVVVTRKP
uniref:Uncharacterized protein n=1 Tax=Pectobacterium phage Koroua TaxID=3158138 RepID=A0AB39ABU4_9CAUD